MSYVTSVLFQLSIAEDGFKGEDTSKIDKINKFLQDHNCRPLLRVDDNLRNPKHPQVFIFAGGYNYFPVEEFINLIISFEYDDPDQAFLALTTEDLPTRVVIMSNNEITGNMG